MKIKTANLSVSELLKTAGVVTSPGPHEKMVFMTKHGVFNVKKSELLASYYDNRSEACYSCSEHLYRSASGDYYLHGCGDVCSPWRAYRRDGRDAYGHAIIPLTEDSLKIWLVARDAVDAYIEIFGEDGQKMHSTQDAKPAVKIIL